MNVTFTTGQVSTDGNAKGLPNRLAELYSDIQSILCDIEIALRSLNFSLQTMVSAGPSGEFLSYGSSFFDEIKRIYGLMNDCRNIAGYLIHMYDAMLSGNI